MRRPVIYVFEILGWADAFQERYGRWPTRKDGRIPGQRGLTWEAVDYSLLQGQRGLPGGSSLAKLLCEFRDRPHKDFLPRFTIKKILSWADRHRRRTGKWPTHLSGPIPEAHGETWLVVDKALRLGRRGLKGGSSLALLLGTRRRARNRAVLPDLTPKVVLAWADAYKARTGRWPQRKSGLVRKGGEETWSTINGALTRGRRGLPRAGSLARFLAFHRGVRNRKQPSKLRVRDILIWARAHRARTGHWPTHLSGPVTDAPGETWSGIHSALYQGCRGFRPGGSLYQLLLRNRLRKFPNISCVP